MFQHIYNVNRKLKEKYGINTLDETYMIYQSLFLGCHLQLFFG